MMMVGLSSHTLFFSLLLLIAILVAISEGRSVYVRNDLGNGIVLNIHCKSDDKDIGVQTLNYQREFNFPIKAKICKTTIYSCTMTWNGRLHVLDAFNSKRDGKLGGDIKWSIQNNRPCLFNSSTKKYDLCNYSYI
ncbi:putative plant self-incompatibility S1 [Lupinus albus]|uniref:S-protein homolog n=1 Tax=Lupinus albus TaxID=3870 RepID=A0A6A4NBS5_LUPAL|nr:putative plant self-incompatibility S1 [Lupinus albus]